MNKSIPGDFQICISVPLRQKGESQICFLLTSVTRKQSTPNVPKSKHFSENLACFVSLWHPFWDSPFCLITWFCSPINAVICIFFYLTCPLITTISCISAKIWCDFVSEIMMTNISFSLKRKIVNLLNEGLFKN